jgi:nucleotidyltransferase substrate binding protein (TIGR01987 family)
LKEILKYKGIECYSPRDCIKLSFKTEIIDDDEILFDILEDRNRSFNIYDQKLSDEIFQRIKEVYVEYLNNLDLKRRI